MNSEQKITDLTVYHSGNGHGISGLKVTLEDGSKTEMFGKIGYHLP